MQQVSGLLDRKNGKQKPLYEQIGHRIRKDIEIGRIEVGERLPSPSRMVKQWNVDYRTVNLALEKLQQEGYIKCEQKRGAGAVVLKKSSLKHTFLYIRWDHKPLFFEIEAGIKKFASENDIDVLIMDAFQSHETFANLIMHPSSAVNGIVVLPAEAPQYREAIQSAIKSGIRVVFVDRVLAGISASAVLSDDVGGAYQVCKHLLDTHRLPVYYFGHTSDPSSLRNRVLGWAAAMGAYNHKDLDSYIIDLAKPDWDLGRNLKIAIPEHHKRAVQFFQTNSAEKYCIFAGNDYLASAVYSAADEVGLKIGKNVFVAGFGDEPFAKHLPIPLTTVRQPNEDIGYEATRILHSEILEDVDKPMHRVLPVELCIRQSSTGEMISQ